MNHHLLRMTRQVAPAMALCMFGAGEIVCTAALAEPAAPGELVIERQVGPRIAYRGLPHASYPIESSVATFPKQPFDEAIGSISTATDAELSTHGSMGLIGSSIVNAMQPLTTGLLGGNAASGGNGISGATGGFGGAIVGATGGLGSSIPSTINQALAPLSSMGAVGVTK
ncbi:MAG: hypothetical protein KGK15_16980 [Burkholderiales bacterium]|nr:hypothetical protein [Burkholderiales bacterium]